jgi:hypothetical protein
MAQDIIIFFFICRFLQLLLLPFFPNATEVCEVTAGGDITDVFTEINTAGFTE